MRLFTFLLSLSLLSCFEKQEEIHLIFDENSPRISYAAEKLVKALEEHDYPVKITESKEISEGEKSIRIEIQYSTFFEEEVKKEGFQISSKKNQLSINGFDESGALYGTFEVIDRLKNKEDIFQINFSDSPEMVMRGTCIGMQKTYLLPGREVYEYPYTEELFPWFYDKELWIEYLDMLVENRYNSLYLWNGHPFASLVKLEDYPFAVEVDEETFRKNEEIYDFLTVEANKRGIWVIQMFYNIIVSEPFAEHYNIKTQDRQRPIDSLLSDYTRKSVSAFIEKYPNVGLLVALGEAMGGKEDDIEWFTKTIIPGVQDGLEALSIEKEPPIILRAHDTDAPAVMEAALPIYKNLYTTHKYNGESLTTYEPRGPWTEIHKNLSSAGNVHISNVHILANLEPFRFGSPEFIRKAVLAMRNTHGANGLHLYPQASYWDWPYTADKTEPRLLEMERDWIWYEAWARYAWDSQRDPASEIDFWRQKLADYYGFSEESGEKIKIAYDEIGEIAPKVLRKFGITEGNRQTLLLGMFASQLVNPYKYRVYPGFYESTGPEGEILLEYVKKEMEGGEHVGETPPQLMQEIVEHGRKAVQAIEKVEQAGNNQDELERLKNDVYAYNAFANCFAEKVKAAELVLRYQYNEDISLLVQALPHLERSLQYYRELVDLTKDSYLYANSMQTNMRRIPIGGNDGKFSTWTEMLPLYENEVENFKRNLKRLQNPINYSETEIPAWVQAEFELENANATRFTLTEGEQIQEDGGITIEKVAEELQGLTGYYFAKEKQIEEGTVLKFANEQPIKLLVGYFNTDDKKFLIPPILEIDASANSHGQADPILINALQLKDYPRLNVHAYGFEAGSHELKLGKGQVIVLGAIDGKQEIKSRDVGIMNEGEQQSADWLFY